MALRIVQDLRVHWLELGAANYGGRNMTGNQEPGPEDAKFFVLKNTIDKLNRCCAALKTPGVLYINDLDVRDCEIARDWAKNHVNELITIQLVPGDYLNPRTFDGIAPHIKFMAIHIKNPSPQDFSRREADYNYLIRLANRSDTGVSIYTSEPDCIVALERRLIMGEYKITEGRVDDAYNYHHPAGALERRAPGNTKLYTLKKN